MDTTSPFQLPTAHYCANIHPPWDSRQTGPCSPFSLSSLFHCSIQPKPQSKFLLKFHLARKVKKTKKWRRKKKTRKTSLANIDEGFTKKGSNEENMKRNKKKGTKRIQDDEHEMMPRLLAEQSIYHATPSCNTDRNEEKATKAYYKTSVTTRLVL